MPSQIENLNIDRNALVGILSSPPHSPALRVRLGAREDFRPDSDVDVLVEYEPGQAPGWEVVDMEEELGQLFGGRRIDLVNRKYLTPRLRAGVLASEVVQFEAGHAER